MKIPNLILLTGLLFLPLASCKIRKAEQAKVWVKNDSITPSTYTKARLVSEDEEKLMVEEDEQTPNEVEADPDTGADSGDAGDAGDAGGDD